jgi:chemotaxis signal transduction protein
MKTLQPEIVTKRFIAFTTATYRLALPLEQVLRVVNCPSEISPKLNSLGLLQLGNRMIRVIDLSRYIASEQNQLTEAYRFLIIVQDSQGTICGIPVEQPPDLVEVPFNKIHLLPQTNHLNTLQGVSHVAVLSQNGETDAFFLLEGIDLL